MKSVDPIAVLSQFIFQRGSQKAAAKALGISAPYICDLLSGRRDFSDQMLQRLGLKRKTTIVEAK